MKKIMYLLIMALLAMGLLISACDEDEIITNPDEAIWSVVFIAADDQVKTNAQLVSVIWIGDSTDYVQPGTMSVQIDAEEVELENWTSLWFGEAELNPGQQYNVKLIIDDQTMCNTNFTIVNYATAIFPEIFDPDNPAGVNWTLASSNQSQVATATSAGSNAQESDEYESILSPVARSFTFSADAVISFGAQTTYSLDITQMNMKAVNYILLVSSQSEYQEYGSAKQVLNERDSLTRHSMRLVHNAR